MIEDETANGFGPSAPFLAKRIGSWVAPSFHAKDCWTYKQRWLG